MKLVKIEDGRVGQIWIKEGLYAVITTVTNHLNNPIRFVFGNTYHKDNNLDCVGVNLNFVSSSLIGFIGITHEIKDNRLVEIPRTELKVDDVVKFNDGTQRQYVIIEEKKEYSSIFENNKRYKCMHEKYGDRELFDFEIKKIGIYGVTHEFVNNCEVRND